MAFIPTSEIHLCQVDFDATYKNVRYFSTPELRNGHFLFNTQGKVFTEYLTVRKVKPDGGVQSSVKVGSNIDDLYQYNYMWYKNSNHGTRIFYAFITKLIYINENTTEIVFETDVYQTWIHDVTIQASFVEREHSITDNPGENVIPEKMSVEDYEYQKLNIDSMPDLSTFGYLVTTTELYNSESDNASRGCLMSGIYQGLHYYYTTSPNTINSIIKDLEERYGSEAIVSIACIPQFNVASSMYVDHKIQSSINPRQQTISISLEKKYSDYTPKNKKLFTSPYYNLVITNHNGEEGVYNVEEFSDPDSIKLVFYGDICANPTVCVIPKNYKGLEENFDFGVSIGGFPQCSYNSDTFKLWLTKNQFSLGASAMRGVEQILVGGALALGSGGLGTLAGGAMVSNGVNSILDLIGNIHSASKEPNKANVGVAKNNLLSAIGQNKFDIYVRTIRSEHAKVLDDFFTMYGYQTNQVKIPNMASRPCFNYVKTIDINIAGGIPNDDLLKLKAIFNNGVTLWHSGTTVGDYSKDNSAS